MLTQYSYVMVQTISRKRWLHNMCNRYEQYDSKFSQTFKKNLDNYLTQEDKDYIEQYNKRHGGNNKTPKSSWTYSGKYKSKFGPDFANRTKTSGSIVRNIPNSNADLYLNSVDVALDAIELLVSKHEDYGSSNISDAPGGALNGLTVRLHDKVARLGNLLALGKTPNYESIEDTFIDILNYAIIALLVIDGTWETKK